MNESNNVESDSSAFIGVSLDSDLFTRDWIRLAIQSVLSKHPRLLFVLGDGLLTFNKTIQSSDSPDVTCDLRGAAQRIRKRSSDVRHLFEGEVRRLNESERDRVLIREWSEYSDAQFVAIARNLEIAYAAIAPFRNCVDSDVEAHLKRQVQQPGPTEIRRRLCALYVLEETAMIIRITEAQHPHEYYPQQHIQTLTAMYSGLFDKHGLTVEQLVNHPRQRTFHVLAPGNHAISDSRSHSTAVPRPIIK